MQYKYQGNGNFYPGLPAQDLNDADLSDDQKALLQIGVDAGIYAPIVEKPAKPARSEPVEPKE